jgi:hypothetical protein
METIALFIKLIIIALATLTVVHYSGIIGKLKIWLHHYFAIPYERLLLRPIDCHICLAFWLATIYFFIEYMENYNLTPTTIGYTFLLGLATSAISHILYKVFK